MQGVENPRGRSDSRASGLVLCSLEERWTGGEQSRPVSVGWVFISWGWGGWGSVTVSWLAGALAGDPQLSSCVTGRDISSTWPEPWLGTCQDGSRNVLSKTWLELDCYCDYCFCSGFWICRMNELAPERCWVGNKTPPLGTWVKSVPPSASRCSV